MLKAADIIHKYISFFEKHGHKRIANAPLVPLNDPTTLFTSSGMQAILPYLLGEVHPQGTRLVNIQDCIRSQDIEEIGDNRHTTFFRMIGNWSLGDYFKKEQLSWFFEFLTNKEDGLGLNPGKLYVTVFAGDENSKVKLSDGKKVTLGLDTDAVTFWTRLFNDNKITPLFVDMTNPKTTKKEIASARIFAYGVEKNWWSRAGIPSNMPAGEPGGPDSEVFYDFGTPHDNKFGEFCHPNCDCGRFMEIGNSVFMQYIKDESGVFKELPKKNVDFGGGFERLAAAINNNPDVFKTDLYSEIIEEIELAINKSYSDSKYTSQMRVIADHLKAATFLIIDGVRPSNKAQGYILRRLLRRSVIKMHQLGGGLKPQSFFTIVDRGVLRTEENISEKVDRSKYREVLNEVITEELDKFNKSLDRGLKVLEKNDEITGKVAFDLFQSYGFPFEITQELVAQRGKKLNYDEYVLEYNKHKQLSKSSSAGMFKGGLADHSKKTVMGHTATHLLHQALRDVLGNHVHQSGSNITSERIRFDFNYDKKLTNEEIEKVEAIVNEKIKENLPVHFELIPTDEAHKMGAIGLFMDTYGEKSKIYFIGDTSKSHNDAYSIEFCGGPHVEFTGVLKSFKIRKQENLGKNQKRLYSIVGAD